MRRPAAGLAVLLLAACAPSPPEGFDPACFDGRTALFRCTGEGSTSFTVRHGDGELALWPPGAGPGDYRVLQQKPAASGTLYRGEGGELRLEYAYGESLFVAPAPAGAAPHVVEHAGRRLELQLREEPCSDDAGFPFPLTVELRLDGQRWVGCGRRLVP